HLDAILALEAEKQTVERVFNSFSAGGATAGNELKTRSTNPVPETDDEKTPASLKALRGIYREQFAKLTTTRATNLKALTDPLDKRLAAMETDFTKKDRLADAKVVRGYREALAEQSGPLSPLSGTSVPVAATTPPTPAQGTERTTINPAATLALKDGITNTLGMKFLPVKGTDVLFCIYETRYSDYAAYAAESPGIDGAWKNQSYDGYALTERKEEHPVVYVSWEDAQKFCAWLSKKEGKTYRLPTDQEWSIAVGIGRTEKWKKDTTPAQVFKDQKEFPWGDDFPPKGKEPVGNYSDESRKAKAPRDGETYMERYDDGYPTTAPVMSYKPNKLGLYDLGGNVWEWCEDWYDNAKTDRVLRGGSWHYGDRGTLLSSNRTHFQPGVRHNNSGFRVVLVVSGGKARQPAGRMSGQCPRSARTLAGWNPFQSRAKNDRHAAIAAISKRSLTAEPEERRQPNPDASSLEKMELPEDNAGSHQGQDAAATVVTGWMGTSI
ncbi:MAG: SUMF1/EgtB/PvdO family nonheme iron enzyme, partial [Verrucomicrobiaceae bacterium]|nr:SUMF1/EgtB/PvdO family nonheme iron enzyme [Verrucomicrobiaceae bacterium]